MQSVGIELTPNQEYVLNALNERGAHFTSEASRRHWSIGEPYYLDSRNAAAKGLRRKFDQGNREAEAARLRVS